MLKHIKGFKIEDRKSHATIALQVLPIQFSDDEATKMMKPLNALLYIMLDV